VVDNSRLSAIQAARARDDSERYATEGRSADGPLAEIHLGRTMLRCTRCGAVWVASAVRNNQPCCCGEDDR
jgi:hypothetical protein